MLTGAHNLRDLGGLTTTRGCTVRTGRVFRSDYPEFVALDARSVRRLGLRTVVDLRRGTEVDVECVDWASHGVSYERWPLTAGGRSAWYAEHVAYLTHRPETLVGAVRTVMRAEGHATLFHCAAGKDRTGVVAALLLSALGVSDEDVIADYVLSAPSVGPVLARLRQRESYVAMLRGSSDEDQEPRPEHMRGVLEWLSARGGAAAWLVDLGVPVTEIEAFREVMLEG